MDSTGQVGPSTTFPSTKPTLPPVVVEDDATCVTVGLFTGLTNIKIPSRIPITIPKIIAAIFINFSLIYQRLSIVSFDVETPVYPMDPSPCHFYLFGLYLFSAR